MGMVCLIDENLCEMEEIWDDASGEILDPDTVKEARGEEMQEVRKHGVWIKVPIETCWRMTGKAPVKTKRGAPASASAISSWRC